MAPFAVGYAPVRMLLATLGYHVAGVVERSAEKEVIWVHAETVVAVVADKHSGRNWPVVQFVAEAMRQNRAPRLAAI